MTDKLLQHQQIADDTTRHTHVPLEIIRLILSFLERHHQLRSSCTLSQAVHDDVLFDAQFMRETFLNEFSRVAVPLNIAEDQLVELYLDRMTQSKYAVFRDWGHDPTVLTKKLLLWAVKNGFERVIEVELYHETRRLHVAEQNNRKRMERVEKRKLRNNDPGRNLEENGENDEEDDSGEDVDENTTTTTWITQSEIHGLVLEACMLPSAAHVLPILYKYVPHMFSDVDSIAFSTGYNAAHTAAYHGNRDAFIWLFEHGATMKREHRYGQTPFHIACTKNCEPIARYCLEVLKVDPETADYDGYTASMLTPPFGKRYEQMLALFEEFGIKL